MKNKPDNKGPQTDDELWHWIKDNLGIEISRVAVCEDHQAPFQFLADVYFERNSTSIAIANRSGSKTMINAIIHLLNSLFRPGCSSGQLAAEEQQSFRAYENLQKLLRKHGKVEHELKHPMVIKSIQRVTEFRNDSKLEILIATPQGVNSWHGPKLATDEAELIDFSVYQESRNMSQSKMDDNGNVLIKAQDWITSTRKYQHGLMQKLLDENVEAERAGAEPPYAVYTWCVFESAAQVPNCQVAYPDCENPCQCDRVVKGAWDDGSPRRFSDICRGRLARSRGYLPLTDIHKTFRSTNQEMYDAQQLCSKPETSGLVFPIFSKERHGIKWWEPDPDLGPIYMSVDFGSTNPSAVNWYQVLNYDVKAYDIYQERSQDPRLTLKAGTRVCFDEIYVAEVGNIQLADLVVKREKLWKETYPNFRVTRRFGDVQNAMGRKDWKMHDPPLLINWFATRDIKEQIKTCRELFRQNEFVVDVTRCKMFVEEAEFYHYPKKLTNRLDDPEIPVDDFNHVMSNFRYCMINLHVLDTTGKGHGGGRRARPASGETTYRSAKIKRFATPRYQPRPGSFDSMHPLAGRKFEE